MISKSIRSQSLAADEQRNIILSHSNFYLCNDGERYVKVLTDQFSQKDTCHTFWIPTQDFEEF